MPLHKEKEGQSVRGRVEKLLSQDTRARNDDIYLIFLYWKTYQGLDIDPVKAATILRNSETIRRCRQLIQEEGLFPPTDPQIKVKRSK